jgi:hypothetical protein
MPEERKKFFESSRSSLHETGRDTECTSESAGFEWSLSTKR